MARFKGLRSYGPGKFYLVIDKYMYEDSLEGTDDEVGESDTTGWYGLLRGPLRITEDLTPDEKRFLRSKAGAIISENSQGFVGVEYYEDDDDLDEAWRVLVDEISSEENMMDYD